MYYIFDYIFWKYKTPVLITYHGFQVPPSWGRDLGRGKKEQEGTKTRVNLKLSLAKINHYE